MHDESPPDLFLDGIHRGAADRLYRAVSDHDEGWLTTTLDYGTVIGPETVEVADARDAFSVADRLATGGQRLSSNPFAMVVHAAVVAHMTNASDYITKVNCGTVRPARTVSVPRAARPRGAGRPAARATTTRSPDPGDGEPAQPAQQQQLGAAEMLGRLSGLADRLRASGRSIG